MWKFFSDELNNSGEYAFSRGILGKYCPNENCNNYIDKINAGSLWLFYEFFGKPGSTVDSNTYKDDVLCIMIWLSYKLSLKLPDDITTLNSFYSQHIQHNEKYTKSKVNDGTYGSYKEIIDVIKEYMDINITHMSKFYELLKLLCKMNTSYTNGKSNDFSEDANKFVYEYEKLLNDNDNNIDDSSYNKVLLHLSNYYNNFEKYRVPYNKQMKRPPLPTEKKAEKNDVVDSSETKIDGSSSETKIDNSSSETYQSINVTETMSYNTTLAGSSLVNKIIPVLSIFAAILFFGGISYKYSLFGFRKRSQKQHLREKIKK
ncbi:putative bir1 protein [Plasmodium yoelii yoelii]|nr:putative bir1 protein [Plasmodium yoelii yoelii]